jgi:glycosidase
MTALRFLFSAFIGTCMLPVSSFEQVVVSDPVFPTDLDSCTVIFDATQGDAGLKDVFPPIYAHTGVITNLSTSNIDWKYVIAPWNQNTAKAMMTPLGNNLYKIVLKPSIREFYGVPSSETIKKIAFVFRNSDGSKSGREANGGDIFIDVYIASLSINLIEPENRDLYTLASELIPVEATSPLADSIMIYMNDSLYSKTAGTTIKDTIRENSSSPVWIRNLVKIIAKNDTASIADSFSFTVIPTPQVAPLPDGIIDGINYIDPAQVTLSLFAPYKSRCFVIGDFNNWQVDSAFYMNATPDGTRFWKTIRNLEPGKEYIFQYYIDGNLKIADPYADKISDPNDEYITPSTYPDLKPYPAGKTTGIASCLQTDQTPYPWDTTAFTPPAITDLVIYELLIRDFIEAHDYPTLADTLDYFKRLGVNAIELMPVMEFEGNSSWGYNPDFLFAPDKYYGTKQGLKQFVEAAHKKGIAVILDIVLNHQFGSSPLVRLYWDGANNRPSENSPWFNPVPRHPYNVGYDFNHEGPETRAYCKRVLQYWLTEYHVDGFRFDLSKGFTQKNSYPNNVALWGQYDASRIAILKDYHDAILSVKPGSLLILEHFADNTEEKELSSDGMLLWGNLNYSYNQATMGWSSGSDFSGISYKNRGWSQPNLVGYMESHDEERIAFKNITDGNSSNSGYDVKDPAISLERIQMAAAFFYTIPGPKMLWEFGELGYDYSINYPTGTSDSRLTPKPIRWDYYSEWRRKYLFNICASLIDLKKNQDVFRTTDYSMSLGNPMKRISLNSPSMDVNIIGNFNVYAGTIDPAFSRSGTWYDYFSGDSISVVNTSDPLTLAPGEYHLYTSVKLVKPLFTGIEEFNSGDRPDQGLSTVYPNPSTGSFTISFENKDLSHVRITVYDLAGRLIKVLSDERMDSGIHRITWDRNSEQGTKTPPGLYFYKLEMGNKTEMKKLIIN